MSPLPSQWNRAARAGFRMPPRRPPSPIAAISSAPSPKTTRLPDDCPRDRCARRRARIVPRRRRPGVDAGPGEATNRVAGEVVAARACDDPFGWGAREAVLCAAYGTETFCGVLRAERPALYWVVLMEMVQQASELGRGSFNPARHDLLRATRRRALGPLARQRSSTAT